MYGPTSTPEPIEKPTTWTALRDKLRSRPDVAKALIAVAEELLKAEAKHKPLNSPHEGYSVILEELDELWDHVKRNSGRSPAAMKEAIQTAAMGLRYVVNLSPVDTGGVP